MRNTMIDLEYCYDLIKTMMNSNIVALCPSDVQHIMGHRKICSYAVAKNAILTDACKEIVSQIPPKCEFGLLAIHAPETALLSDIKPGLEPFRATECSVAPSVLLSQEKTYKVEIILFEESKEENELLRMQREDFWEREPFYK